MSVAQAALSPDALRDVFNANALAAMRDAGIKRAHVTRPFSLKTNEVVCEFWFTPPRPYLICHPRDADTLFGLVQFTLYAPAAHSWKAIRKIVEPMAEAFDRKTWGVPCRGTVKLERANAQHLMTPRDDKKIGIVDVQYEWRLSQAF